jgi:hypothetical protein
MRLERIEDAHNHILAVKDVYLDSPAHQAGIQPFRDLYALELRRFHSKI